MTKQISPAELAVGMYITVLNPAVNTRQINPMFDGGFSTEIQTITNTDRSGMGKVLKVLAVELPYVVLLEEHKHECGKFTSSYDTREHTFMELNSDYVKALCPHLNVDNPQIQ